MNYISTRDNSKTKYTSAQVIKQGLANDGGLFVPECIPTLSEDDILSFSSLSYPELAAKILSLFLTDYTYDELYEDCKNAYSIESFPVDPAPLKKVDANTFSLELWHGPTCAFKDMALQVMPRLLSRALRKTGETKTALILVATSGDTGKAALEGYRDVEQIKIAVFYPESGVSAVQKMQMRTQVGNNVNVCAVEGNFDDIQSGVKRVFADECISKKINEFGYFFSSANSINFGRLAPQIVYYVKAYCDLLARKEISYGERINVCVPTGNFGNILAAYIAKLMGIPINKLICASNSNNILTDFFNKGEYDINREFHLTMSPSMDILISSNLERLLYLIGGSEKTSELMRTLKNEGAYHIDGHLKQAINQHFKGYFADESKTADTIKYYFDKYAYLMDTHTAVAFSALNDYRSDTDDSLKTVVASTASPYKFAQDVHRSIFGESGATDFECIDLLSEKTDTEIPHPLRDLDNKEIRFSNVTTSDNMIEELLDFLKE